MWFDRGLIAIRAEREVEFPKGTQARLGQSIQGILCDSAVRPPSWGWRIIWIACVSLIISSSLRAAEWETNNGFRSKQVSLASSAKVGFSRIPSAVSGITFTNLLPEERHLTNQILLNGAGVAAGDLDGDGWCDLFFSNVGGSNRLYRNLGNWTFNDLTATAGIARPGVASTGVAMADLDGDRDLDLVVNSIGGGTQIFFNQGNFRFTAGPVLNAKKGGMSLALADVDGDGYLDLYIANYRTSALMDIPNARATFKQVNGKTVMDRFNGRPLTEPDLQNRFVYSERRGVEELGEVDAFYRNHGGTNFAAIPFTGGTFQDEEGKALSNPPLDWGLDAMFRDINGDGFPDLYVCNDFYSEDRIWINDGAGHFRAPPRLAMRKSSLFSMGVDFADINRDGLDDILVVDMLSRDHKQRMKQMGDTAPPLAVIGKFDDRPQYGMNTLFLNRGDGTYAEIAQLTGLHASEWSWTPLFLDVDLDGWEDVLVSTGNERAARDLDVAERLKAMRAQRQMSDAEIFQARKLFPKLDSGILAFRNMTNLTFLEMSAPWGFDYRGVSHGMALADLDNDGDLDLVVNNFNDLAGIYRNDSTAPRLAVQLRGAAPNTQGIGARIKVFGDALPIQAQEIMSGGRYLSCDQATRVFAAGNLTNQLTVEVAWRSGKKTILSGLSANRIYEIDESSSRDLTAPSVTTNQPSVGLQPNFRDVSQLINHTHHEEPFDDFARQPLLPYRLSQAGPGVSWYDWDGDGWDDLTIASGKGGLMGVYRNDRKGGFQPFEEPRVRIPVARDQTTLLYGMNGTGPTLLLAGSSNYEDGLPLGPAVRQLDFTKRLVIDNFPPHPSSTGPMALADIDGDNDLDLFVGGTGLPRKYPQSASSFIYRNAGGKSELDSDNSKRLANVGLVSGAVFSDLDADGDPDLVLACHWGPVRVFKNNRGHFSDATEELKLSAYKGWWNGVTTGDFNGDGKLDIAASNWGRNTQGYLSRPLRIYYGDLDGDRSDELVEAHFDSTIQKFVPERQLGVMARSIPLLREKFTTHAAYASASVEELLGERQAHAKVVEANWLESTVFLNRGTYFEPRPLPIEAQMAPAFGVTVGDLDGDGHEDLFLSQNFFATQPEVPRYDAGRGLWLRGNGTGGFTPVSGQASGIQVYGEQRGCALADFDRDGRVDLVVTQNGASTKLYQNVAATPGLRIRLKGPEANPTGIGASVRLVHGDVMGATREIHAGSGYWSQDSPALVMALPQAPTKIWVHWPGGRQSTASIPAGAREIEISMDGRLSPSEPSKIK